MKKDVNATISKLINGLFEGHIADDDALYILQNVPYLKGGEHIEILRLVISASVSIARLAQQHHSDETLKKFFNDLGSIISEIDSFLVIIGDATTEEKTNLLNDFRKLPQSYIGVMYSNADSATLDSTATDLVIQYAINGMLFSVMEIL